MEALYCGSLIFDMEVDKDGELEVTMEITGYWSHEEREYINKDQAKKIIEHLQKVFNLKEVSDDPS